MLVNFSSHSLQTQISSSPMFAVDGRLSGNLGLAWISATVGDSGAVKGDLPGAYPLAYTHTCLCRIPLHFQALFRLESGGSKQEHSSACPVWSHNTQPTEVCDPPSSAARTYCCNRERKKRLRLLYPNAKALSLFSFFSHVNQRSFISVAVKSKALLSKVGKAFLRGQSKIQLPC